MNKRVTKLKTIKTSYVVLGFLTCFVICNIPLLIGNCCSWGGIPEKRKQWISVSFWSDYIIWLLNANLFKILELLWISAIGNSVYIILFEFENLWHECKFYRWWIKHHQLLGMVCPFCTKSQKAMLGFTGEEVPFKRRLQIQVRLWSFFLWFSFGSCFPRTYEISPCTLFLGFHLKLPFITHYEPVQVTLQTDQVKFNAMKIEGFHLVSLIKSFLWV